MIGDGIINRIKSFREIEKQAQSDDRIIKEFTVNEVTESMIWFETPPTESEELTTQYPAPVQHEEYGKEITEFIEDILECEEENVLYKVEFVPVNNSGISWRIGSGERIGMLCE